MNFVWFRCVYSPNLMNLKIELISNVLTSYRQTKWAEGDFCSSLILYVFCLQSDLLSWLSHQLSFSQWAVQDSWTHLQVHEIFTIYDKDGQNWSNCTLYVSQMFSASPHSISYHFWVLETLPIIWMTTDEKADSVELIVKQKTLYQGTTEVVLRTVCLFTVKVPERYENCL